MEIKYIYYYVPPCPKCGSRRTGRYLKEPKLPADIRYTMVESLKNGELVRMSYKVPENNAYCEDCGYEWPETIMAGFYTAQQINEEMQARGTVEAYSDYVEKHPKKRKTILGKICGFFP